MLALQADNAAKDDEIDCLQLIVGARSLAPRTEEEVRHALASSQPLSLPLLALMAGSDWLLIGFFTVLAVLIVVRHKSNIQRLLAGTENRFTKK